ncbi:MAG: ABC transporter permease subunit [Elusimicrobia bacterium]|nr:ABC transporter permease subunit [Elusimicrobiota bacterium]
MASLDWAVIGALARRTFRSAIESPIAYVAGVFFYLFVGTLMSVNYFAQNQASLEGVAAIGPWGLWFVVPVLTMGLLAEEMRSGTFESLSTLPVTDAEIVIGKFAGFAMVAAFLVAGLFFYVFINAITVQGGLGLDWGGAAGTIASLFFLALLFGAVGLFASSLAKNQVVAVIIALLFCTFFFLVGQFYTTLPGGLARLADFLGVSSHLASLSRGVWDIRDIFYFISVAAFFLFLTVQRLATRRF